ncbi:hypothetical protein JAAARDRAFT_126225 [Jaapia argillacea MUCL 33604]|uniref:Uncharacterized protein n=1 Tax=Jaapia argillacea MUCL 33604 TaxID=933084 RepID=A0A067PZG0_9AGAM|nr:hypothetical protein JAAARDRAFT_126225 [Jaapia argillacea MUCL 33604]
MVSLPDPSSVKVYTVNGATSSTSSSLPDWLTLKRRQKSAKSKRSIIKEQVESTLQLIQHFEFPEASNRIKTTRDGKSAIATGTYKPHMKVWDLEELSLKFERHSDVENVDFIILSDDWTKSLHLQTDRSIELHTQSGFHYRTRIPKFGRSLAYHFPSCDALFGASSNEVYRLNLEQGRFLSPFVLGEEVECVNAIDVNPAHQLFAFGVEGNGSVEFWDPRSRSRVGLLSLPASRLLPSTPSSTITPISVTALSSRSDGLNYAVGTSTGHTLLYDIRSANPFAVKDQGYGLAVKNVSWVEGVGGGRRMGGEGLVISADKKVVKIWEKNDPTTNFASITPPNDINDVHHVPSSGLIMLANEGIQMTTYFIPQLGPAPRWCSFLENITEEMEDQTTRSVYEDFKFVERGELASLGLDHLIGTAALKPYMHGYFVSLKLYDAARVISNPFAYAEHRERVVREKMEKMAEGRIRAKKDGAVGVKVNKALAEKIRRDEERGKRKGGKGDKMDVNEDGKEKPTLLTDDRFKALFEDPDYQVDETTREFALLNPSTVVPQLRRGKDGKGMKTAVEEEEEESDKVSSDGLGESSEEGEGGEEDSDSSEDDDLRRGNGPRIPRTRRLNENQRKPQPQNKVRLVPMRAQASSNHDPTGTNKNASFGQRRSSSTFGKAKEGGWEGMHVNKNKEGGMEMSWVPSSSSAASKKERGERKKGKEVFGAGMEKGGGEEGVGGRGGEKERSGRTERRRGMRSGSKNVFRRM